MLQGTRRLTYWLAWCCMLSTTLLICMIIVPIPVGQQCSVPCVLIPLQSVVFALVATILTWSPPFDVPAFLFHAVVFIFYAFSPFSSLLCSSLSCSSFSCLTEFHCNQIQRQRMLCKPSTIPWRPCWDKTGMLPWGSMPESEPTYTDPCLLPAASMKPTGTHCLSPRQNRCNIQDSRGFAVMGIFISASANSYLKSATQQTATTIHPPRACRQQL